MATWMKARTATITVNSVAYDIDSFSYDETYSEFDATTITGTSNTGGILNEDFDVDVVSTAVKFSFLVDSTAVKKLLGGRKYPCSYTSADGDVHSGNIIITTRGKAVATKGSYKVSVGGKFAGGATGQ